MQKSTEHLPTLDGLRGVAAFAVLLLHVRQILIADDVIADNFSIPHVFLAVDFFFILSGFVIAKAYEGKLKTSMSFRRFVAIRLTRLYPLVLIGIVLSIFVFMVRIVAEHDASYANLGIAVLAALFFLPTSALWTLRPGEMWPINPPQWSLFYELIINFIYAPFVNWFTNRKLTVLCLFSALAFLAYGLVKGRIDVGAVTEASNPLWGVLMGYVRVTYSFFVGILIYRRITLKKPRIKAQGWILATILALVICLPFSAGGGGWIYDLIAVLFVLPAIVYFSTASVNGPVLASFFLFIGELSYPLYITHNPILRCIAHGFKFLHMHPSAYEAIAFSIAASIVVAIILDKLWDRPIRKFISNRYLQRKIS